MAKSKIVAGILSFLISGLGLLYIDHKKYLMKFLFCFFLSIFIIPWLLGIYWSVTAPEVE